MNKKSKGKHNDSGTAELEGMIRLTSRGFGYVEVPGRDEDIEIPPELLNTALDRDTVKVVLHPKRRERRIRGEVVEVLSRSKTRFVGTVEEENGFLFVRPDDRKCYIDFIVERGDTTEAPLGQKVAVELLRWSTPKKNPLVRIVEILGPAGTHETEMRSIVAGQGFDWHFPGEVERQAEEIERDKEAFFAREVPRRRDFRGVPTYTIDPEDAKDFDDAISVRTLPDGHIELGVHIADVSAYMTRDSAMDQEAQKRATSIYLVDRTIPMLPEALSNDLCSLVPNQERLAMSAVFTMTAEGEVLERWFGETVIKSDRRFSYREAQDILDAGAGELHAELLTADTIARALRKARFANGSIAFDTDEIKFELDEHGKPVRAYRKVRLDTMLMIEDLMLLANREVATWVWNACKARGKDCVFVWRIHDSPKTERIEDLALFLKVLGHELPHKNGIVSARAINALFEEIEGAPEQDLIETATIRAMAKAIYSVKNIGHFGLAFDFYTHFTSPIRRYPDVMVHRIVKSHLAGTPVGTRDFAWHERMCAQSTEREIAAMEAERDSVKLKQVEFLSTRVGETFDGVVTGINDWGLFVAEAESMAEGLVRVSSMRDDFYELADHGFRLTGSRTGKTLSLGDKVRVRLKTKKVKLVSSSFFTFALHLCILHFYASQAHAILRSYQLTTTIMSNNNDQHFTCAVKVGEKIPDFTLKAYHKDDIIDVSLKSHEGKWLILFFYPADFTFVCPTELEEMAGLYDQFVKEGAEVMSVSTDTHWVHKAWHDESEAIKKIKFPMLADPTGKLSRAFGVYIEEAGVALRGSFLIDPKGVVQAMEVHADGVGRSAKELLRKFQAAKFVTEHGGQVCPASWQPGDETLKPGLDLVGKI